MRNIIENVMVFVIITGTIVLVMVTKEMGVKDALFLGGVATLSVFVTSLILRQFEEMDEELKELEKELKKMQ